MVQMYDDMDQHHYAKPLLPEYIQTQPNLGYFIIANKILRGKNTTSALKDKLL